jgi:ABC-type uncharacterized transport system permease subunit
VDVTENMALVVFAAISPMLISFVKQSGFPKQANALIALGCYIVVGIAGALVSGEPVTAENAVALIAVATVVGSTAYQLIWSNLGTHGDEDHSIEERLTVATSIVR